MKVRVTFDFTDEQRRALADLFGEKKPLSHARLLTWLNGTVESTLQDIVSDYGKA